MKNQSRIPNSAFLIFLVMVSLLGLFSLTASAAEKINSETWGEHRENVYTYADFSPFAVEDRGDSPETAYEICTPQQLAGLAALVNAYGSDVKLTDALGNTATATNFFVNGESQHIKLMADIDLSEHDWIPIGSGENKEFKGSFDGAGHTISGLLIESATVSHAGIFGYVTGGTIKNVGVSGEIKVALSSGNAYVGGLVGYADSITIENCYSTCAVSGSGVNAYVGGLAGQVSYATITNSYNTGNVSATGTTGSTAGGLVGVVESATTTNCYSACDVSGKTAGGCFGRIGREATITACYWYATDGSLKSIGEGTANGSPIQLSQDQMKAAPGVTDSSWKMITISNSNVAGTVSLVDALNAWVEATPGSTPWHIHDGEYPTPGAKNETATPNTDGQTHTVSCTECFYSKKENHTGGEATCTEKAVCKACGESYGDEVSGHSTTADGDKPANCGSKAYCSVCDSEYGDADPAKHDETVAFDSNGFCANGCYEPAADSNADGYYEIDNAGKLFWFANHINTVDRTASAVLTADIDLENRPWTPIGAIGENSNNFRGVFDGQNHTIKGLYVEGTQNGVGFFGEVRTGTVKNFTIYGEVIVNTEVDYVGGVIGSICGVNGVTDLERNGAIIQNITSYVNLTAKAHGVGMIGGFVGYADHQSLIENCSWYGTFDAGIYCVEDGAGGFIGHIYTNSSVTICNCAAYGTIKTDYAKNSFNNTPTIYMGGFLSFSDTGAGTTLENCLFAGKFERGVNLTDEARLGAFGTLNSVKLIKNCYYLGDGVLEAVHSDSNLKPGSDNVEITSVTKAQLLSGEVAYKLGEHFGQTLEGENRQSYPVLGGTKVEDSQRFEIYGQQLNIGGDLSMKYYVMGYAPAFHSGALYMEFSHNAVKTKVYADEPNADGFYVFVLEGINPQCMGDNIYAMLYYNGTEVARHGYEKGKEYSVEKNLLNLLEKYKDDANLVALINDTLAYGKAASEYKKHDTMTGDYTVLDSSIPDATVTPNGAFTGYTVVFGQVNFIKVSVELADGYTLYLDGTDITTQLIDGIFKTDGIAPTNFDKKFSFEIKNGDTSVQTFAVSVNDYIGAQKNSATMGNLVKALYNYGYSAKVYPHLSQKDDNHLFVYTANEDGTHTGTCVCGEEVIGAHTMSSKTGDCTICNALVAAASITVDTVKTYYYTFEEAVAYANGKEGTVIVVENDCTVNDTVDFESGSVTIDLNGKAIDSTTNYIFHYAGGSITIRDGVGGGRTAKSIQGSTVIIEGGTHAELVGGNHLIVTGGNFARVAVATGETATISGGSFEDIGIHSSAGTLAGVLADGYCFYDKDGNAVDVSTIQTDEYGWYNLYNVTVGAIKEN